MAVEIKKGRELIRICVENNLKLEYSKDAGANWSNRYMGNPTLPGNFKDLSVSGKDLMGETDKGLFYSKNNGKSWYKKD
jgi:hypothetical protein